MKKYLIILATIGVIALSTTAYYTRDGKDGISFGAFGDSFKSIQLATNPVNGYILQTDGVNSSWVANSGGGGAAGVISTTTALANTQVVFSTGVASIGNDSAFTYIAASDRLTVTNASTTAFSTSYASSTSASIGTLTATIASIPRLSNLTSNGFVKTSGANGTLSVDTNSYLTGSGAGVTAVSVASANGFTGSSSGGATPAITLTTSITGLLKGNGTAISAASSGTDYEVPVTAGDGLTRTANDFDCDTASGSVFGCLASADWTTFNNKQAAGNYITALTGDVTASGPNSVAATLATVNSNVGSFTNANITVNAKGLITAASNGSAGSGTGSSKWATSTDASSIIPAGATNVGIGTTTPRALLHVGSSYLPRGAVPFTNNNPVAIFGVNADEVNGVAMSNINAGTNADFRFVIQDTTDHYIAFSQPGINNAQSNLFGQTRPSADFIFSNGGTTRNLVIGNVSAKDVIFGTNNAENVRIVSGGNVGIGTSSPYTRLSVVGQVVGSHFTATTTSINTFPNASTTNLSVGTNTWLSSITSSLIITGADGLAAEYAGTSCTNQFIRSLSALGVATCATVANTDLANSTISGIALGSNLANLTATNSTLTFSGTYNGGTARTIGLNLGNANTWTVNQTFNYSSSTVYSSFAISSSTTSLIGTLTGAIISATQRLVTVISAAFTPATEGEIGIDTTSNQFKYFSGGAVRVVSPVLYSTFTYATSTAFTGTTTIPIGVATVAETWVNAVCYTDAGTAQVSFYDGTNRINFMNASTTANLNVLSTNNTFTALEKRYVDIGTPASSPTKISCTIGKVIDAN